MRTEHLPSPVQDLVRAERLRSGMRLLSDLARCATEKRLQIPRTSLTIFSGIALAFPESTRFDWDTIAALDHFSVVLIATNEAADIGISADLQRGRYQHAFYRLLEISNLTQAKLEHFLQDFTHQYPEYEEIAKTLLADFFLLSRQREALAHQQDTFLDLDSAIFEAACLELVAPGVLQDCGLNFSARCTSAEQLVEKYSVFLPDHTCSEPLGIRLRALHAIEMLLKMNDDTRGIDVDATLNLPNFQTWAQTHAQTLGKQASEILAEKQATYTRMVQDSGMIPTLFLSWIEALFATTSQLKAHRSEPENTPRLSHLRYFREFSTTLRHELVSTGWLKEIFLGTRSHQIQRTE